MAKIDELTFGPAVIEGKNYSRGISISVDGTVRKRSGCFLMFGRHEIQRREPEELSHRQPEVVIVGAGTDGVAHIAAEAESRARANSASLVVQPYYHVIVTLNELAEQKKKVTGLIHVTC